jgi:AraC-like DNA-binding protein
MPKSTIRNITDPEQFEEYLALAGGETRIRPLVGSRFRAALDTRMSQRVRMFKVDADSLYIQKSPQNEHFSLNIPLSVPFTAFGPGYEVTIGGTNAYLSSPGPPITYKARKKCGVLTCQFPLGSLETYRQISLQETTTGHRVVDPQVSLLSASGSKLFRTAARVWVARGAEDGSVEDGSVNDITLQEMEDDILACFLQVIDGTPANKERAALPSDQALKNIEDYICANLDAAITRDDLVEMTGVSIRSLSRAFEKKYGLGPMAFVRQRRLDTCFRMLNGSDREMTTVTNVALSHGFDHLGKFAVAYKKVFGESPSETLLK